MTGAFRNPLAALHRWTGLTVGLVIAAMALTGSFLAWRAPLQPLLERDLRPGAPCAAPQGPDALLAAARAVHPEGRAVFVRLALGAARPASVRFRDEETVFIEPCSGRVLGEAARYGGLFGRLEQLHKLAYWTRAGWDRLLPGTPTHALVTGSVAALFATALIAGGFALLWPGRGRSWRTAVTVDRRLRGRALRLQLHGAVGFWIGAVALTSASTGLTYAFEWPRTLLAALDGPAPPPRAPVETERRGAPLPLDAAWAQARLAMPDLASAQIILPQHPDDPVRIRGIERGAPHPQAFSTLVLDAFDGRRLDFQPYAALGAGTKAYYWARAIHTGDVGGVAGELVLTVGALGTLVSVTAGFSSYFRKRAARRAGPSVAPVAGLPPELKAPS